VIQFLHAADLHLDSPLQGLERYGDAPVDAIRAASRRALDNLVRLAVEERVDFVLVAGDLWDSDWKDQNSGLYFVAQLGRLREAGIQVVLVTGNHDAVSQITRTVRWPDNVKLLSSRHPEMHRLKDLEVAVCGQSFASRAVAEDLASGFPPADPSLFTVGLLHTSLTGREGHGSYAPCTLETLRSRGYGYWALGHVHQREVVCRDPWIVFSGTIQGRHARETGPKGCTLVRVRGGVVEEVEHRELDVVRWALCRVDARPAATAEDVLDLVRGALEHELAAADGRLLAARVRLECPTAADAELRGRPEFWIEQVRALGAAIAPDDLWIEKVLLETTASGEAAATLDREDALGALLRAIRQVQASPDRLDAYAEELAELKRRVPADLFADEEPPPWEPQGLRTALTEAKDLLSARLADRRGEPR
jgi:DNA repair protein SbcD/Mre11